MDVVEDFCDDFNEFLVLFDDCVVFYRVLLCTKCCLYTVLKKQSTFFLS